MAGELRQYHPQKTTATWAIRGGAVVDLTQGLIDATNAIQETKDAARWSRKSDRQGNTVRNALSNNGGTIAFTYLAEAAIHDTLSKILLLDGNLQNQVGDIVIRDLLGTTIMVYVGAFIQDDPVLGYGDTASDRTYLFGYSKRIPSMGGANTL